MNYKHIFSLIVIISIIFVSGCNGNNNVEQNTSPTSFKDLVKTGKVDIVEFGIGSKVSDILKKMGKPKSSENFIGGAYLEYDEVVFFVDTMVSDLESGKVVILGFSENSKIYGIKIGMTFKEIKNILGEPSSEGLSGSDNGELYGISPSIIYENIDYQLIILGAENSEYSEDLHTKSAYLR